jgi:hypothetical protein
MVGLGARSEAAAGVPSARVSEHRFAVTDGDRQRSHARDGWPPVRPAALARGPPRTRDGRAAAQRPLARRRRRRRGGRPVLLVPGFLAGDRSPGPITRWLRAAGRRTTHAGLRVNVTCSGRPAARWRSA